MGGVIDDLLADNADYFGGKMSSDCYAFIDKCAWIIFDYLIRFEGEPNEELRLLAHLAAEKAVDRFSFLDEPILRDEIYNKVEYMLGEDERSPYYVSPKFRIICRKD